MTDESRRVFLKNAGTALGVTAAVGCGFSLYAMKRTWDPLPSVVAGGTTTVDTKPLLAGVPGQVEYRGKPVFIMKKTSTMTANDDRDVVVDGARFTVLLLDCTHLGCVPIWQHGVFHCACHGGAFDGDGMHTFGPPPRPLEIPPFRIDGARLILGEEGPEYRQLREASLALDSGQGEGQGKGQECG